MIDLKQQGVVLIVCFLIILLVFSDIFASHFLCIYIFVILLPVYISRLFYSLTFLTFFFSFLLLLPFSSFLCSWNRFSAHSLRFKWFRFASMLFLCSPFVCFFFAFDIYFLFVLDNGRLSHFTRIEMVFGAQVPYQMIQWPMRLRYRFQWK